MIDESLAKVSEIQSNRYVKRLSAEVEKLQEELLIMSETIEQWKECQRNWLYLENVSAIHKPCQTDFDQVNKTWCKFMKTVSVKYRVRSNCGQKILDMIIQCNLQMERIQKNLEDHLDKKRIEFPRFYFLSNDELLQLFAQSMNLDEVNRHINKCFDNVKTFEYNIQLGNDPEVTALNSQEGEVLVFHKPRNLKTFNKGDIADWIQEIQNEMYHSVKRRIKDLYVS